MPRPCKHRRIKCNPGSNYFKPRGIPMHNLEEVVLERDELEAVKLADFDGLKHEEGAVKMNISRATFGRILEKGRYKIAESIIKGKAIKIN
ncbi:MAG: DUF134 domain-containing protein [Melioribacteraceae bacterium]|jgi:predicted DNA-binding protein (UPF0251 family)|nr:DUF134 domain-containing protein [Melioribacteraceae bacterium]RJP61004.1 MAG: DUF134 domain-containing protein [Ignavibacteriales bacterium]WKZ70327.1 MAG: DUF134 domain-containing protein [Melioribacteraceae bacterium]